MRPLDNLSIARLLAEIGDMMELRGDNAFRIRAYRIAADTVANSRDPIAQLSAESLRALPGIGRDISARIVELASTGRSALHEELRARFPPSLLELLRLQGLGPKGVAQLHQELQITSLDDLEQAAVSGRLQTLKGMGPRKVDLLVRAIAEKRQRANQHLLPKAAEIAARLVEHLQQHSPDVTLHVAGSVRRGAETCGVIELLAVGKGSHPDALEHVITHPLVEHVGQRDDREARVSMRGGFLIEVRAATDAEFGAAFLHLTGSPPHVIALRQRAHARGMLLNEHGLFADLTAEHRIALSEEGIYEALGLPFIAPELREDRGEVEAASAGTLPPLVARTDLRGDLHMHTTESDGKEVLEAMVMAARDAGLEYVAITDHSKALAMANGLDEARALAHAARIRALNDRIDGIRVLAGIECDILPDGSRPRC